MTTTDVSTVVDTWLPECPLDQMIAPSPQPHLQLPAMKQNFRLANGPAGFEMKDTALYEQLPGLKSPWSVKRVDLSLAGQRVPMNQ